MSFGIPNIKPQQPRHARYVSYKEGPYGVSNVLTTGVEKKAFNLVQTAHPIEYSVKNRANIMHQLNMNVMRSVQGLHAPMRLKMELNSFKNVGRLPFLPSSNASMEVLLGHDETTDFSDFLHPPEVHEKLVKPYDILDRDL